MPPRRILLLGDGDIAAETAEALRAAGAEVTRFPDPSHDELRDALGAGADATLVDPETGRELEELIGNCTITSVADIVAPTLAAPCLSDELCAVLDGDQPVGLLYRDGEVEVAALPEVRVL